MGSPSSPEMSDITFHDLEMKIIQRYDTQIIVWFRFRDDIFMIFNGTEKELNKVIKEINTMHPTYEFSFESSTQEVIYLD